MSVFHSCLPFLSAGGCRRANNAKQQVFLPILLITCISGSTLGALEVAKTGDARVDAEALVLGDERFGPTRFSNRINGCSFQQDAVVTHGDWQYVGYYDGDRRVCIARRQLREGPWEIIRFDDHHLGSNDAHNTISIGIAPGDGTIHMAFDHHVDPLHYRVSQPGAASRPESVEWNSSLFGPIVSELEPGKPIEVTYPRFFQTPSGGLQICYRKGGSGNGTRTLVDYDPQSGRWTDTRQIDSPEGLFQDELSTSDSRGAYPNGYTYGPSGRLHTTWVWREDATVGANHDLMYMCSDDGGRTWLDNLGNPLSGPARVDTPGINVVAIDRKYGLMNTHGQDVDSKERIHTVMRLCTEESLKVAGSRPGAERFGPPAAHRYVHFWRQTDGSWVDTQLPGVAGSRPKLFIDEADNAVLIAGIEGNLVIMAAQAATEWSDWNVIHVEKGPFHNEMLGDTLRWKASGVLSVLVQETPQNDHGPTPLRILDFEFR